MEECGKFPTPLDVIQRIPAETVQQSEKYWMGQGQCSHCSRHLLCISEPVGWPYLCRECYTGLTNEEIGQRMKEIGEKMGERKHAMDS